MHRLPEQTQLFSPVSLQIWILKVFWIGKFQTLFVLFYKGLDHGDSGLSNNS